MAVTGFESGSEFPPLPSSEVGRDMIRGVTIIDSDIYSVLTNYEQTVLADRPLAYWRLDETSGTEVADTAGHASGPFNATYRSAPGLNQTGVMKDGSDNSSVDFTPADNILGADWEAFDFAGTAAFSLEAWFNTNGISLTSIIIQKKLLGGGVGWELIRTGAAVGVTRAGATSHGVAGGTVVVGTDYYVVATYDGTTLRLYLDAVEVGTDTDVVSMNTNTVEVSIAEDSSGATPHWFDGRLDEMAVYDRALTETEIAEHYAIGTGLTGLDHDHATPIRKHAGIADAHHNEAHTIVSHSDTTATGAELETLTDGSETALHSHAGGDASPLTTKGDLFGYDTDDQRIPIGTDGYVLKADSGETLGVIWAAGAGGTDSDAIHDNVASEISAVTAKGTPVGGDFLIIEDSAAANAKKSVTVAALEAILSHDNIAGVTSDDHHTEAHNVASHSDTTATGSELETLTDGSDADALHTHSADGIDTSAIHDNESAEISVITEKGSPVNADLLLIEDSAASNVKKRIQIGNLPGTGGGTNLTTKGDLHGYDTGQARIPVGATDGHVLVVDSAETLGVKWAAGAGGTDSDAIHDNVDAEISAIAAKGSPTDADFLLIEDAAASNAKKRITIGDLPGGGGGDAVPAWMSHLADRTIGSETVHADDDEFDDDSISGWTLVQPSGTQEIVEKLDVMSIRLLTTFSAADMAAYLKSVPGTFPMTLEVAARLFTTTTGSDFLMCGPLFTDGTSVSSQITMAQGRTFSANTTVTARGGTLTAVSGATTTLATMPHSALPVIVRYRVIWVAANTFKIGFSPDGVTWSYTSDFSRTLTPTHMGFGWTSWGENPDGNRWVTYDYFRVTEADLSL